VHEWLHSYAGGADGTALSAASTGGGAMAMPTHDGVRVHDDQGCSPIPPRVGEQHPKQSISVAQLGTSHGALAHGQLLTEGQILERDRSVSTADQRESSKGDDERSQHE